MNTPSILKSLLLDPEKEFTVDDLRKSILVLCEIVEEQQKQIKNLRYSPDEITKPSTIG